MIAQKWLKSKGHLRPAVEEIESNMFQEKYIPYREHNIEYLRDIVGENGHQYYSVGDMNDDGKEDFALLLFDNRKDERDITRFALAIFNAPFKIGQSPTYYEENLYDIGTCYLVFDRRGDKRLYLGKFESDVYCSTYYPKGKTYHPESCHQEGYVQ